MTTFQDVITELIDLTKNGKLHWNKTPLEYSNQYDSKLTNGICKVVISHTGTSAEIRFFRTDLILVSSSIIEDIGVIVSLSQAIRDSILARRVGYVECLIRGPRPCGCDDPV